MNNQPTRPEDKKNPTFKSHLEQDKETGLFNLSFAMASQFTESEHLNGPGRLSRRMSTNPRFATFILRSNIWNLYFGK